MGRGGFSNFDRFARRQGLWRGQREIERPEQPERSADALWLEENNSQNLDRSRPGLFKTAKTKKQKKKKNISCPPTAAAACRPLTGTMPISKSPDPLIGETAGANPGKHASAPILGDLGKLTPSLAAGIRRVAGTK